MSCFSVGRRKGSAVLKFFLVPMRIEAFCKSEAFLHANIRTECLVHREN